MARAAVIPKSPPKRTTRTRGRPAAGPAASTAAARAKAKTTASKPAAEPKERAARAATTDATDELTEDDELGAIDNQENAKPTRGQPKVSATTTSAGAIGTGRGRKPAARPATPEPESDDDDELAQEYIPKTRVGRPRTKPQPQGDAGTKQQEPTARPRGRPKGSTNAKSTTTKARTQTKPELPVEISKSKQVTINSAALRSNMLRGPAKKKTVTFQDVSESEEEEKPAPALAGRRRGTTAARRQTGVTKSARKPATGGTGRGRKPAAKGTPKPLSPKKANQVTKSITSYVSSDGEDDELSGAKNQVKFQVNSPTKHGSESTGLSSPVKRINFTPRQASKSVDENGNPVRRSIDFNDIISMSSPTREPSPSPFHYTMKETPKRVGFAATEDTQPISQPNFGPSQNSPLKASPKKGQMETPKGGGFTPGIDLKPLAQPNFTATENSPLKASPKKGHFDTPKASSMAPWDGTKPLVQPNFTAAQNSPLKASPKKGHFDTPKASSMAPLDGTKPLAQPNFTPAQNSPLKTSPKKGNLAASFSQSAMKSSAPSLNARTSFLQSPAKRTASPFKSSMTLKKTPLFAPQQPESTIPRDEDIDVAAPSTPEVEEPSRPHDEDNDAASPLAPEAEEPLGLDELDDDVNEDKEQVGGEPDDGTVHTQAEVQSHVHDDEMERVATSPDAQPASNVNGDHASENIEEQSELPTHQDVRQEFAAEFSPDFGDELAETFAVDTENRFEVSTQDDPNEHYDGHVNSGIEAHAESDAESVQDHGEQDADDLIEYAQPEFEDHTEEAQVEREEPPKEPEDLHGMSEDELQEEPHETEIRHQNNHVETNAEAKNKVHEESDRQSQQDYGEPEIQHEQEVSSPQLRSEHPEDVGTEDHPVSETADQDDQPGEDFQMRSSKNEDHHETPIHRENEESDDDEDVGDFEFDGETTLVNVDVNQQYMDDVRLLSPERRNQMEREPSSDDVENLPAPVPSPPVFKDDRYRDAMDDKMYSDEDSQSDIGFTTENNEQGLNLPETPDLSRRSALGSRTQLQRSIFDTAPHFTPLAQQFSQWKTSTPKESERRRPRRRGVFSIGGVVRRPSGRISVGSGVSQPAMARRSIASSRESSLANVSTQQDTEEDPMESIKHAQQDPGPEPETIQDAASKAEDSPRQPMAEIFTDQEPEAIATEENHEILRALDSIPSQDASPTPSVAPSIQNERDDEKENENIGSPAPAPAPVTPRKNRINSMQAVHTVSKVPLKPDGDVSPLKMPIKRRRSLSNASPTRSSPRPRKSLLFTSAEESMPSCPPRKSPRMEKPAGSPRWASSHRARSMERRQSKPTKASSRSPSPAKSPRKSVSNSGVLEGAVVYADVHTTEGEDASGIFVELLQQMGAKCIRNWSWNPRASLLPEGNATAQQIDGKLGITHVVFKDGGVRTLEKVRYAGGLVKCVGVGWVLDCERENKWLDEAHYAVDSSIIPRGGAKRRKSMEPRALSNVNGTLIKTDPSASSSSSAANRRRSGITPPISQDSPQTPETTTRRYDVNRNDQAYCQTPKTPGYRFNMEDYVGMSPATPFYLSRAKLVQQSCPPKQTRQGLFPTLASSSKRGEEDEEVENSRKLRLKLEAARRKSLAYKPRKGSPLVE